MDKIPKFNEHHYTIYKNDLKYKSIRNLDPTRITWESDDIKKLYYNTNLDSMEYRLKECEMNDYEYLDLGYMDLTHINDVPIRIAKKIKFLFLNNNNLSGLINLSSFVDLEVIDVSYNKIETIIVPPNLKELCCKHNVVKHLDLTPNLKILDCSFNKIFKIPQSLPNLEILHCDNNLLEELPSFLNLKTLTCKNNKINKLGDYQNLVYLDCSYNKIINIGFYYKLKDCICKNNKLNCFPVLSELVYLEIFNNNKIDLLDYMPNLKELYCDLDGIINISTNYKVLSSQIYNNKYHVVTFA